MTDIRENILKGRVHAANIHDTMMGGAIFAGAKLKYPLLRGACGDDGYRGTFVEQVTKLGRAVDISVRIKPKEWEIPPKRWRVERTFWSEESMVIISHTHTLFRRY